MISFVLYILAISTLIQHTLAQNPVCDGTQIIYATPPTIDPFTGEIIGAGLDAITLSVDEANTIIQNVIGIAKDFTDLTPDQQPEMEIIRSASINPLTTDLVLLYQEIDYTDPLMNEPRQRLVIIPGFKLNSLLVPGPGILGYLIDENIDLAETELDEEYPLTEIAFDCAGNLLGVTAEGELVQMIIEPGSSDLETRYIGPVQFQGAIIGLTAGFVGLTYDFQTNTFVAVGGVPVANTLVQFAVSECEVFQFGNPIIITDQYALCPLGIVDIESRGNNQFYVSCAIDATTFGLAILELVNGVAEILPINAADGQSLVTLPNSSGGALIPSIPSTSSAANENANAVCFPRNIGAATCNVIPTESDCEGDINIQLLMTPPAAGSVLPRAGGNIAPPPQAQPGLNVGPVSGTYDYAAPAADYGATAYGQVGTVGAAGPTANGLGTAFDGQVLPGTAGTGFAPGAWGSVPGLGLGLDDGSAEFPDFGIEDVDLSLDDQGESVDGDDEGEDAAIATTDSASEEEEEDVADDEDTSVEDDEEESLDDDEEDESDDDQDDEEDIEVEDDDEDDDDDESGESEDDDDIETDFDDDMDDEEDTLDGDGDDSVDDDDTLEMDGVDDFGFDFERGSAEDAALNGNNMNQHGLFAENGYGNGQGTMISLSPSTLGNLWGLAMIFLAINVTFLCVCYYRHGQCQKKQVTVDHEDSVDVESL